MPVYCEHGPITKVATKRRRKRTAGDRRKTRAQRGSRKRNR